MIPTRYEFLFKRPLPADYEEYRSCLGCGVDVDDSDRDCGCPCGIGYGIRRKDGAKFTWAEREVLYAQPPELPVNQSGNSHE